MKKKSIDTILNNIINNSNDSDNTISFNDLNEYTKNSFNNVSDITDILDNIKTKLGNDKIFIRKKDNSFEILLFIGTRYDIFDVKIKNGDLIVKNVLFDKPIYDNLPQLVGKELIDCYKALYNFKYNINNYVIKEDDFSLIYNYDVDVNKNGFKIEFNDIDNTSLEKKLFDDNVKINCISYNITNFILENLQMIMDSIRISKEKCPKGLIEDKINESKKIR